MAVTYSTLFTRLGKLFGMASVIRTHQAALRTDFADVLGAYTAADSNMIGTLANQIEQRIKDSSRLLNVVKTDAENTLIEMVDDDLIATYGSGLDNKNVQNALRELIRQMDANSSSVDGTTVTIGTSTAGGSNKGNGTLMLSALASQVYAPDVVAYPSIKTELIRATCTQDSYKSGTSESAEKFLIEGQGSLNRLEDLWPKGSGIKHPLYVASPNREQGSTPGSNVLRNSNFESFTSNAPDHWTIVTGTAGSTVDDVTTPYTGTTALKITGDGSTAVKLTQAFNSPSGTLGTIKPDTPYTLSFAVRRGSTSMSAGNLKVYVTDGTAVLNNSDANRKMEISIAHNIIGGITTVYQLKTLACMTPAAITKGAYIVIETDVAFNTGVELYIDNLVLAEMHRPVAGGLAMQMIGGSTDFATEDTFTAQVTNNGEGAFNTEFDRFFDMTTKGYALPANYAGSETINDGLIS